MKILVIGSEGNIGTELVKYLRKKEYEVVQCDQIPGWRDNYYQADINNPIDLVSIFNKVKPDVVYHLAAMVSRVTCEATPGLAVQTNLVGLQNVIELCKQYDAKMIYFSTSEVYGNLEGEMDEETTIPQPNNRYGLTKFLGEKLVEHDVKNHGLNAVTVRPFMFYHEDETRGDHRSAMIRFIEHLSKGEEIEVHLNSERAWMHLDDAVVALERLIEYDEYGIFNLGSEEFVKTEELAQIIADNLGVNLEEFANYIELPGRMTLKKRPNLSKMKNTLGFTPKVSLKEGVSRVISKFNF